MDERLATQIYIPKPQRASYKRLKSSLTDRLIGYSKSVSYNQVASCSTLFDALPQRISQLPFGDGKTRSIPANPVSRNKP